MRRALAIAAVAAAGATAAASSGCGGGGGSLERPLSYLPAGTPAVALVSTDLDGSQWHTFNGAVAPLVVHASVRRLVRETADQAGLSFGDDVKPLLGNRLVVGLAGPGASPVAALQVRDAGKLDGVLRALRFRRAGSYRGAKLYRLPAAAGTRFLPAPAGRMLVAVDGDAVVWAPGAPALRAALDRQRSGGGLTQRVVDRGLHGLPGGALVQAYGNLRALAAAGPPWVRALRTWAATVSLKPRVIEARVVVRTAARQVAGAQVPLAPGRAPAPIPVREDQAVVGLRDAAPTAAFAVALGGAAARAAGLLRQLAGPAFAAFDLDGNVWARAGVRDARAAALALRRIAPRLGLRPAGRGVFRRGAGGPLVTVLDGQLVAAPSRRELGRTAAEPSVALSSVHGGLVARADLAALGPAIERAIVLPLGALDDAVAFVNADRAGLRAVLRIGIRPS